MDGVSGAWSGWVDWQGDKMLLAQKCQKTLYMYLQRRGNKINIQIFKDRSMIGFRMGVDGEPAKPKAVCAHLFLIDWPRQFQIREPGDISSEQEPRDHVV